MRRRDAFEIASGVADLGIDCSVSIAAPHPGAGIPENCMVHILSMVDGVQFTRLVELIDEHNAEFQLDRHDSAERRVMKFVARLLALPFAWSVIVGEAYEQHRPVRASLWAWLTEGRLV